MGVLDDIGATLGTTGPTGPKEVVVETPVPKTDSSMDRIARQLLEEKDFAERVNSVIESDPRGPITLPKPGQTLPRPNLPITFTPRPPINGVAQDPNDLDIFQRNEIQRQLEEREKNFIGPRKPLTDAEISKMHPEPSLGYGGEAAMDVLANVADQLIGSFNPKRNPQLAAIGQQFRDEGPGAITRAIPEIVTSFPAGVAGFLAGTAVWISSTFRRILEGQNVGDAIMDAEQDGAEISKKISTWGGLQPEISPLAQGVNMTIAAPFTAIMESSDSIVSNFTDDPRIRASARLAVTLALIGGGERAVKYFRSVAGGKAILDAPTLEGLAREGGRDTQVALVAQATRSILDPQIKLANAMTDLASRMDDAYLIRKHFEDRVSRDMTKDPAEKAQYQLRVNVLGKEIKDRGLVPVERAEEWFLNKYPTLESQQELMGPTLGIQPLFTDPKWYWYLRGKGMVPEGFQPPPGAERYAPASVRAKANLPGREIQVPRVDAEGKPILDQSGKQYIDTKRVTDVSTYRYDEKGNRIEGKATVPVLSTPEAAGKLYDQRAVGYDHPQEGYQDIPTGGSGRIWTEEEARAAGWPEATKRNKPLGGPEGAGGPGGAPPTPGAPPAPETPPAAQPGSAPAGAKGAPDDPAVQLFEAIQSPGLTVQTPEMGKTFRQKAESWVQHWLDRFYAVHKYTKQAGHLLPGMNPSLMIKAGWLSGITGKAEARIFNGGFDTDIYGMNKPNGMKSLSEIYRPFQGDMEGFDRYLIARAAIEEEGLNRFRKPSDWVHTGVDLDEAKAYVDANAAKYEAGAKEYTKYFHKLLDDLADADLISSEARWELKSKRPNYAPLRRDMEDLVDTIELSGNKGARQTLDRVMAPLYKRLGSDRPILPPTKSAIIMTYEIESAIGRQRVARAIVDLRKQFGMEDVITQIFPGPKGEVPSGPDIVMVRRGGKPEYFRVPQDLAESMKMIYEAGLGEWVKRLSIPSRWLRTGATSAPGFAVRNPIRDWQTAFINSRTGFNPITDFARGLWSLITKDDTYWDWKKSGAEWSMLVTLDKDMAAEAIREMKAETATGFEAFKAKWLKSPLGYLEKLSELGEKPTRIGVFARSRRPRYGLSDMEAAAESRSASTDFAVRGSKSKALAALYTFLNARAQTTYKLAQTAKEHPVQFILRGLASAALPTLVLYALNRDDPEYWKRSAQERRTFWFLPIEIGGRQVKLPKGEIGIIFGNVVETILEALDSKPETRVKVTDYLQGVFQTISPIGNVGEMLPTAFRPIHEWITNKKYYSGTAIENETEKQLARYLRYGPYTSETVKAIGQAATLGGKTEGISPKKLENFIYGYTGGVGRMTLGLADWLAGKAGILPENEKPKEPLSGTPLRPIVQGFLSQRAVGFESEPVRMFYAAAEAVSETEKTLNAIAGRVPGSTDAQKAAWIKSHPDEMRRINEELKRWIENHPNEMELLKISKQAGKGRNVFVTGREELSRLRKAEQKIGGDTTMSAEDKRKALDLIDKRVSAIVDPVWRLINAVSSRKKGLSGQNKR